MAFDILSIGGCLVEIMRDQLDSPLDRAGSFVGPFPSGDTPIFIDVAARLKNKTAFIGVVGDDSFGKCITDRLSDDGVDISQIRKEKGHTTGTAFVAYYRDGSRQFLFHWGNSAAGMLDKDKIDLDCLKGLKWLHLTGVTLSVNEASKEAVYYLLDNIEPETKVSFDPNIRPEVLSAEEIRELCKPIIEKTNLFFPSETEAMLFTGCSSDEEGCRQLASQGKLVVLKNGKNGCVIYNDDQRLEVPSFKVDEVDPTGAGDSFAAGFITALLRGSSYYECGRFANAVGALSVLKQGPMEGAPTLAETEDFLKENMEQIDGN